MPVRPVCPAVHCGLRLGAFGAGGQAAVGRGSCRAWGEQLLEGGLPGPVGRQVQPQAVGGAGDPGRGVNQLGANGAGAGSGMAGGGQRTGGAGEVVGDCRADQPGGVRGESPGRQVRQRGVLQVGDDLLDDGVVAVGGLGGQHRFGAVGEHGVVAVDGEHLRLPGWDGRGVEPADPPHDQPCGDVLGLAAAGERGERRPRRPRRRRSTAVVVIEDRVRDSGSGSRLARRWWRSR